MKNRIIYSIILLFPLTSFSQSMEKAILLNEHGLIDKAKSEAINLITSVDWHPNGATHLRTNGAT